MLVSTGSLSEKGGVIQSQKKGHRSRCSLIYLIREVESDGGLIQGQD